MSVWSGGSIITMGRASSLEHRHAPSGSGVRPLADENVVGVAGRVEHVVEPREHLEVAVERMGDPVHG